MLRRSGFSVAFAVSILSTIFLMACGNKQPFSLETPTAVFAASADLIAAGQSTTLEWQTSNATSVTISPAVPNGNTPLPASGSLKVSPSQTTEYTLIANGQGGTARATVTITVAQKLVPTITLEASPRTITPHQTTTLKWETGNAMSVTITPSIVTDDAPDLAQSGAATIVPTETTTYTATASGPGGTATARVTVEVAPMGLDLAVTPPKVAPGEDVTIHWSTVGVSSMAIDNGIGDVSNSLPNGSITMRPQTTTAVTATATGNGGTVRQTAAVSVSASQATSNTPIKHIIFMLQENRSFDNYLGMLGPYRASRLQQMGIAGALPTDVDGFDPNVELTNAHTGVKVKPFHEATVCTDNLSPSWSESHHDVTLKGGDSAWSSTTTYPSTSFKMRGFLDTTTSLFSSIDPNGTRAMGYYDQTDLPFYYELGTQFAISDRWYSSLLANTFPNRMYSFAATSEGHVKQDPLGHVPWVAPTIFRALNQAGVSWRYYYQDGVFLANFADWSDPIISGKTYNISNWYQVLAGALGDPDKMLPQVIFIEAGMAKSGLDEHPGVNIQKGAADVQRILAALMNSDAWQHSVFVLSFDEAGGLYDHVPPVQVPEPDGYQPGQCPELNPKPGSCGWGPKYIQGRFDITGMRLPLIVISPWVKPHFVSHIPRDTTAILAFIETTFNVPSLTRRDQYFQDPSRNMGEFFDFSNAALLNPPSGQQWSSYLPAQPNSGLCSFSKEVGPTY